MPVRTLHHSAHTTISLTLRLQISLEENCQAFWSADTAEALNQSHEQQERLLLHSLQVLQCGAWLCSHNHVQHTLASAATACATSNSA